jgi:hypothetical protein
VKKVVATVRFTHPVDKTSFEKRVGLRMRVEPVKSFDSPDAKPFGFKVSYDEGGGAAYVHSDSFAIPSDEAEMLVTIADGTRSARGGPGAAEKLERTVHVPGIESYFRITVVTAAEVENEHEEIDRVATVASSAQMRPSDLGKYLSVVLLPKDKPPVGDQPVKESYRWSDPLKVTPEVETARHAGQDRVASDGARVAEHTELQVLRRHRSRSVGHHPSWAHLVR